MARKPNWKRRGFMSQRQQQHVKFQHHMFEQACITYFQSLPRDQAQVEYERLIKGDEEIITKIQATMKPV